MKATAIYALALMLALTGNALAGGTVITQPVGQSRVSGTCPPGSSIRAVNADGSVVCETDDGSSFSALDVIPKGNGTGLAPSLLTDDTTMVCYNGCAFEADADGTTWTADIHSSDAFINNLIANGTGSFNGAVDIGGNLFVGGGPTKFTVQATTGNITTLGNSILGNSDSDTTSIFGAGYSFGLTGTTLTGARNLRLYDTTATAANVGAAISLGYDAGGGTGYQDPVIIKAVKENGTAANRDTALVFATATEAGVGTPTERMRIRSDGGMTFNGTTGSDGYVLTVDPTTHIPKWAAASGATYSAATPLTLTGSTFDLAFTSDFQDSAGSLDLSTAVTAPGSLTVATTLGVTGLSTLTGGVTTPASLTTTGTGDLVSGDDITSVDDVTVGDALAVVGASDLRGAISNSTGTLTLSDSAVDFGADSSSVVTASNGIVHALNWYGGKHYEWNDEYMDSSYSSFGFGALGWVTNPTGTGAAMVSYTGTAVSGRPGIAQMSTGTTTTGYSNAYTSLGAGAAAGSMYVTEGTWAFEATGQFVNLSTSSEEYWSEIGFLDNPNAAGNGDGCFLLYDRANTFSGVGGVNTGNADKWQACTNNGGTRSCVLLNGTSQNGSGGAGSITTVDTTLTAASWWRAKIVAQTGSCAFSIDTGSGMTLRATMTINIPATATAIAMKIAKTVGTTARMLLIDQTAVSLDLTNVRSP
ncbi:MAG TPA: hypothetical protein VMZ53_03875 [Kofleriaceae bacterium]|nr:hypothetical protein [Kofleriaceae bacterium]